MFPEIGTIGGYILSTLPAGLAGAWFWYDKKKVDTAFNTLVLKVEGISNKQIEQEAKFVTETRTREILKEELSLIRKDLLEVKTNVNNISSTLSELSGNIMVLTALQDIRHNK